MVPKFHKEIEGLTLNFNVMDKSILNKEKSEPGCFPYLMKFVLEILFNFDFVICMSYDIKNSKELQRGCKTAI